MGFRKRESNQEGFGIQRNEKMKAGGSMPKKPRKKAKKKPVTKKQGEIGVSLTLPKIGGRRGQIRRAFRDEILEAIEGGASISDFSMEELAFAFGPKKAANIIAQIGGADNITMTNQQDQGQIATGGSAVATGGSANASAEANPNIDVDASMSSPAPIVIPGDMPVDRDMPVDGGGNIPALPGGGRGSVIMTPEGPMVVDPITGVLIPVNPGPIQGNPFPLPGGYGAGRPVPLPFVPGIDPVTGMPFEQGGGMYDDYGMPIIIDDIGIRDNVRIGDGYGFGDGGMKYQGSIFTEITKGDEEKMKAGGTKKKKRVMKKGTSNRYGY